MKDRKKKTKKSKRSKRKIYTGNKHDLPGKYNTNSKGRPEEGKKKSGKNTPSLIKARWIRNKVVPPGRRCDREYKNNQMHKAPPRTAEQQARPHQGKQAIISLFDLTPSRFLRTNLRRTRYCCLCVCFSSRMLFLPFFSLSLLYVRMYR